MNDPSVGVFPVVYGAARVDLCRYVLEILLITRLRRLCGSDLKSMLRNSWLADLCAIVPCLGFYFLSVWLSFSVYIAFAASFIVMLALLAVFYHNDIKELITKKRGLL